MQLVELLEVPQLVDACARNNFHDEAIELAAFVNSLERKYLLISSDNNKDNQDDDKAKLIESQTDNRFSSNGNISKQQQQSSIDDNSIASHQSEHISKNDNGTRVIQGIVDEVQKSLITLRQQLLAELTENTTLSRELHILSILRKLDNLFIDRKLALEKFENQARYKSMTEEAKQQQRNELLKFFETRLQMCFLEVRSIWLKKSLDRIIQGQYSHEDLSPLSAVNSSASATGGVSMVNISNDSNTTLSSGTTYVNTNTNLNDPYGQAIAMLELCRSSWLSIMTQFIALFQDNPKDSLKSAPSNLLLGAWLTTQVNILLNELKRLLPLIEEGTSLRTVLEQGLLFAQRMGEAGGDFSGLIVPLFQEVIVERLQLKLNVSLTHFKSIVATERWGIGGSANGSGSGSGSTAGMETIKSGSGSNSASSHKNDDEQIDAIVPLFTTHHLEAINGLESLTMSGALGTGTNADDDDTKYIGELMMYLPLAYFCNDMLETLNFVRECPMLGAKDDILSLITETLHACCVYIVSEAGHIKSAGRKHLGNAPVTETNQTNRGSKDNHRVSDPLQCIRGLDYVSVTAADLDHVNQRQLDIMYALATNKVLIPHILTCFDQIFQISASGEATAGTGTASTGTHKKTKKDKIHAFRLNKYASEAKAVLSPETYKVLISCIKVLEDGKLLPSVQNIFSSPMASRAPAVAVISTSIDGEKIDTTSAAGNDNIIFPSKDSFSTASPSSSSLSIPLPDSSSNLNQL